MTTMLQRLTSLICFTNSRRHSQKTTDYNHTPLDQWKGSNDNRCSWTLSAEEEEHDNSEDEFLSLIVRMEGYSRVELDLLEQEYKCRVMLVQRVEHLVCQIRTLVDMKEWVKALKCSKRMLELDDLVSIEGPFSTFLFERGMDVLDIAKGIHTNIVHVDRIPALMLLDKLADVLASSTGDAFLADAIYEARRSMDNGEVDQAEQRVLYAHNVTKSQHKKLLAEFFEVLGTIACLRNEYDSALEYYLRGYEASAINIQADVTNFQGVSDISERNSSLYLRSYDLPYKIALLQRSGKTKEHRSFLLPESDAVEALTKAELLIYHDQKSTR